MTLLEECIDQKNQNMVRIRNYDDQNLIMTVGAFGGFVELKMRINLW